MVVYNLDSENVTFVFSDEENIVVNALGGDNVLTAENIGEATLNGAAGNDTLQASNFDLATLNGNGGNDILIGASEDGNTMNGGAGDDELRAWAGPATMVGGSGDDIYRIEQFAGEIDITESLNGGLDTVFTDLQVFSIAGFAFVENLTSSLIEPQEGVTFTGNAQDNRISGTALADVLNGGGGDDVLDGSAGGDSLSGGAGNDTYIFDEDGDVAAELAEQGADTVKTTLAVASIAAMANIENLEGTAGNEGDISQSLSGNSQDNRITGRSGDDSLNGGAGDDVLDGGAGGDVLAGGSGDDNFVVDDSDDSVVESNGEGFDTVRVAIADYSISDETEVEALIAAVLNGQPLSYTLRGNDNDNTITGLSLNDTLSGGEGNDILNGGAGDDVLAGERGDDQYVIAEAGDVVTELQSEGTDTIRTSLLTYVLTDFVENIVATGAGVAQILNGNDLANVLTGSGGDDELRGAGGNDTYVIEVGGKVVELSNGGTDTVRIGTSYSLASNVENLTLTGSLTANGTGNSANNVIIGNVSANRLSGGNGDDTLSASGGADILVGGAGRDRLSGGSGNDIFDFNGVSEIGKSSLTRDIVRDFAVGADDIDLRSIDASTKSANNNAFTFVGTKAFTKSAGELRYSQSNEAGSINDRTLVLGDINGDGVFDFQVELTGLHKLSASDFLL